MVKIKKVVARVTLNKKLSATTTLDAEIIPLSEYGGKLQYITVNDGIADITMTLPVYQRAELPTTVTFKNAPAVYASKPPAFTCSPARLNFTMDATKLASLTELSVADIDLTTLNGVKIMSGETKLKVTVEMSGVTSEKNSVSANNVSFINVPTGYKAVLTQTKIPSVEVVGPESELKKISSEQLFAEVDLSNADPTRSHGTAYARAYVKDSNNCWVHNRYTVSYRLEKVQ